MVVQELDDPREQRHVSTRVTGQPDRVRVLLDHGLGDLLRSLVKARVDDLVPRVAKSPGHDLRSSVVPVEAGLSDDDPVLVGHRMQTLPHEAFPILTEA